MHPTLRIYDGTWLETNVIQKCTLCVNVAALGTYRATSLLINNSCNQVVNISQALMLDAMLLKFDLLCTLCCFVDIRT